MQAQRLVGGVRDPELPALLSLIDDGGPIHPDNRVTVYLRGEHAFHAMHEAIDAARDEVLFEAYIVRGDDAGRFVGEALAEAAARGVRVRMLADSWGSLGTGGTLWRRLTEAGVTVRFFHPLLRKPWLQQFRDHRKILTVDRRVAFTGGMNIGSEYGSPGSGKTRAGRDKKTRAWRDTHCRLEGPVAWEMATVFYEGWERSGGKSPSPSDEPTEPEESALATGGERALVLDSRPGRGHEESAAVLAALAGAARETFWVTNAYFAPRRRAVDIFCRTAARGVDVRLLLPGVTDVPLVRHAGHGWFVRLLEGGVRVWEYRPAVLHAKTMVADGFASVIGSSNLDFRSFRLNAECNVVVLGEETGAVLAQSFEEDLARSDEIRLASWNRSTLHCLGDRLARWLAPLL